MIFVCLHVAIFGYLKFDILIINMVRTRGNLSRRGSHNAPESSAQGGARKRPTVLARRRGQHEANVIQDDVVEHRFPMFLRTRSRGLITMVQDFQVVPLIHL